MSTETILSKENFKKNSISHSTLEQVKQKLKFGWHNGKSLENPMSEYYERRFDLSMENDVIFWHDRVIIPNELKKPVLEYIHGGHQGIGAMRSWMKCYVWGLWMNNNIEKFVSNCEACQSKPIT
ncbi:hypothetical protein RF11_06061 [Thelohanellus kitauei]|uniref:Integrase zinc-binding domain-containing protein n=1 Tax=Thelohanellus kitauei TaxID=669202 RepID=A0A0C2IY66_THEKT|nr:hypothetical protein RF11_06061 [Thelohanellus kitauei]